jgi:hypothetical protein
MIYDRKILVIRLDRHIKTSKTGSRVSFKLFWYVRAFCRALCNEYMGINRERERDGVKENK